MTSIFWLLISSAIGVVISLGLAIFSLLSKNSQFLTAALVIFMLALGLASGAIIVYITTHDTHKRAVIFIRAGKNVTKQTAILSKEGKLGCTYKYNNKIISVPEDYGYDYINHVRLIEIDSNGGLIYVNREPRLQQSDYNKVIKHLTLDQIGSEMIYAVRGKPILNWIIIAIIAFVAGIGITFVANAMFKSKPVSQPPAI